jgi:predicted dehydrogenase
MTTKLRIAVIGAGRLGGFHAQKLAARDDVALVAVVDPLPANRERVAAACGTEARADYAGLVGQIDAAVVAAPTSLHHAIARDLLQAGVHLLVEKPLCVTGADADELVAVARRHNLVLQVGHVERFNPAFQAAADQLTDPKYIEAVRATGVTFRSTDVGVVLDLMIHDLDLVLALNPGLVRRVDAVGISVLGGHEDAANVRIEFENGCVASLNACRVSHEPVRRMQIWGPHCFASVDFAARTLHVVEPSETLLAGEFDVARRAPAEIEHNRQHFMEEHLPRRQESFAAVDALQLEQLDFVEAIRTRRAPRVTGQHGRDAVALAEEILRQIDAHAWDGTADGRRGAHALPGRSIVPAPHFQTLYDRVSFDRRRAG